jgi:hypothetical protein
LRSSDSLVFGRWIFSDSDIMFSRKAIGDTIANACV